jgi:DNA-binding NtrC family response regulator
MSTIPNIGRDNLSMMSRYSWPGNIRELRNVLERALILSGGRRLDFSFLTSDNRENREFSAGEESSLDESYNDAVARFKRSLIEDALVRCDGKRQEAARLLGMTRHGLKRQMKTLGFFEP